MHNHIQLRWHIPLALILVLFTGTYASHAQAGFGQQWEKGGVPIFSIIGAPGSWNAAPSASPNIIGRVMYDGTEYKAYPGGYDGLNFATALWTSKDLESGWTVHSDEPVLNIGASDSWESNAASNATVIFDEGVYKMWYVGSDPNMVTRIGYATSPDGVTWTKHENNPVFDVSTDGWDSDHLHTPFVLKDGSMYKMWYAGHDGSVSNWGIGLAESQDGISWTRVSSTPVLKAEAPWESGLMHTPTVLKENGKYLMWYTGQDAGTNQGGFAQTGFAVSDDGMNWTKDPANPILKVGKDGDLDSDVAIPLGVFKTDPSTYKMSYGATNLTSFFGGLVATLTVSATSVGDNGSAPTAFELSQNFPNPFNPQTTIRYVLGTPEYVTLEVFDMLGNKVATLVDEVKQQGSYHVQWVPRELPSGMYVYRMTAGEFTAANVLVLQK